jgi:hypothetical protein
MGTEEEEKKDKNKFRAENVAQVMECLPSKYEALSSYPSAVCISFSKENQDKTKKCPLLVISRSDI